MSSREAVGGYRWLWNRLRCMSVAEVIYRFEQMLETRLEKHQLSGAYKAQTPSALAPDVIWLSVDGNLETARYILESERICSGELRLFSSAYVSVGATPRWNRCPITGVEGPRSFAPALSLTDRATVGDIKYVWELNRHLQLVTLGQAYALTGEKKWLNSAAQLLSSWFDQCPYLQGPNWTSSLELAIRLINWAALWQLIGGDNSPAFEGEAGQRFKQRWLESIFQHCDLIVRHYSRHSSANNHLLGELTGVYVASRIWPCWLSVSRWGKSAKQELEHEANLQNGPDGVNREQAFAYQAFVAEFLLIAERVGQASGDPFSEAYLTRISAMMTFVASIMDVSGNVPEIGDADDAEVLRLDPTSGRDRFRCMLEMGGRRFGRGDWLARKMPEREEPEWFYGKPLSDLAAPPSESTTTRLDFNDSGYFVFGSGFGTAHEIKGLIDCGALGYLGIAAHGHADALSLVLSVAGEQILVDPGTYAYRADMKWREYFRGTSAHNTVRVDGLNQSISGGRFMWTHKAKAKVERLERSGEEFLITGSHDGYLRLSDPVKHRRTVEFKPESGQLVITDQLEAKQDHDIEQFWHFGEDIRLEIKDKRVIATGLSSSLELLFEGDDCHLVTISGQDEPPLGWMSREYDVKFPITTLCRISRASQSSLITRIQVRFLEPSNLITDQLAASKAT